MADTQDEAPSIASVEEEQVTIGDFVDVVGTADGTARPEEASSPEDTGLDDAEKIELELLREARLADKHTRKGPTPFPRPRPNQTPAEPEYATPVAVIIGEYVSAQAAKSGLSTPASIRMDEAILAFMYEVSGTDVPEEDDLS